jgi:hypothetical protein
MCASCNAYGAGGKTAKVTQSKKQVLKGVGTRDCKVVDVEIQFGKLMCALSTKTQNKIQTAAPGSLTASEAHVPAGSILDRLFGSDKGPTASPMPVPAQASPGSVAAIGKGLASLPPGQYTKECFSCTYDKTTHTLTCDGCNKFPAATYAARGSAPKKSGKQVLKNAWIKNCMSVMSDMETGVLRCTLSKDQTANIRGTTTDKDAALDSKPATSIFGALFGSSKAASVHIPAPEPDPMLDAAEGSVAAVEKELESKVSTFDRLFGSTPVSKLPPGSYKKECFGCTYDKSSTTLACKACNTYTQKSGPKKSGQQLLKTDSSTWGGSMCEAVISDTKTGKLQCMRGKADVPPKDEARLFADKTYPTTPGEAKAIAGKTVGGRPGGAPAPPAAENDKSGKPGKGTVDATSILAGLFGGRK